MLQLWAASALGSALGFLAVTEMDALSHLFGSGNTAQGWSRTPQRWAFCVFVAFLGILAGK